MIGPKKMKGRIRFKNPHLKISGPSLAKMLSNFQLYYTLFGSFPVAPGTSTHKENQISDLVTVSKV